MLNFYFTFALFFLCLCCVSAVAALDCVLWITFAWNKVQPETQINASRMLDLLQVENQSLQNHQTLYSIQEYSQEPTLKLVVIDDELVTCNEPDA